MIPCRIIDGETQVLLIAKHKKTNRSNWSIPKGIVEPGLTPQASGTIEAEEEAGVLGHVGHRKIGEFTISKWGATCLVGVYAFLVTDELADGQWESGKRVRQWFSVDDAVSACRYPAVGAMISPLQTDGRLNLPVLVNRVSRGLKGIFPRNTELTHSWQPPPQTT